MKATRIGTRKVGENQPVLIIAEIGSNHDGKLDRAKELIKASAEAGADAVKFQSFSAEGLLNKKRLNNNNEWEDHPSFEMIKNLELPDEWHQELARYAAQCSVIFLSTPFEEAKADLLNKMGVPAFKIASGDLTHIPLLRHVARFGKPIILSTGTGNLGEVQEAVDAIRQIKKNEIILLHCVSNYPPRFEDANIKAMATMAHTFNLPVGYSDHTPGISVALGAVALGACVIEKHITFDRSLNGPDHSYAMEVDEFREMVNEIRNLEKALGDGIKKPVQAEIPERIGARRSLYARVSIPQGTAIGKDMVKIVRHAYGPPPKEIDTLIGKKPKKTIRADELIEAKDLW